MVRCTDKMGINISFGCNLHLNDGDYRYIWSILELNYFGLMKPLVVPCNNTMDLRIDLVLTSTYIIGIYDIFCCSLHGDGGD